MIGKLKTKTKNIFLNLRIPHPKPHYSHRFPGISFLHVWKSLSLWWGERYGFLNPLQNKCVCSGVPLGHLPSHHSPSGDSATWQSITSTENKKHGISYPSLHRTRWSFYYKIHTNHNTKNICNIWWDLPETHVIKTACCFCIVNVTLAHYPTKITFSSIPNFILSA